MNSIPVIDDLIKEYLLFRGFTSTYRAFDQDRRGDKVKMFQVDKLVEQLLSYVSDYQITKVVELWNYLNTRFFSRLEQRFSPAVISLQSSLQRFYIVSAIQNGRPDKVTEFLELYGEELAHREGTSSEWQDWFVLPFIKNPEQQPRYSLYFSKNWRETFLTSLRNFFHTVFSNIPLPRLLAFNSARIQQRALEAEVEMLRSEVDTLRLQLDQRTMVTQVSTTADFTSVGDVLGRKSNSDVGRGSSGGASTGVEDTGSPSTVTTPTREDTTLILDSPREEELLATPPTTLDELRNPDPVRRLTDPEPDLSPIATTPPESDLSHVPKPVPPEDEVTLVKSTTKAEPGDGTGTPKLSTSSPMPIPQRMLDVSQEEHSIVIGSPGDVMTNYLPDRHTERPDKEPFQVTGQDVFTGHISPVNQCRFSPLGTSIASGSRDGTVHIWSLDSFPATKSSLFCNAEVLSLEWQPHKDGLLLCGTSNRHIKTWSTETKRVVSELKTDKNHPRVIALAHSPTTQQFISASASKLGDPSPRGMLSLWNIKVGKVMQTFQLEPAPTVINSLSYNHNGNMVATAGADGMIRIFDLSSCSLIMGWQGHSSDSCAVVFNDDETGVLSAGLDGKIIQWSLYKHGKVVRAFTIPDEKGLLADNGGGKDTLNPTRMGLVLSPDGKHFALSSSHLTDVPLYHINSPSPIQRLTGHTGRVNSVDWHPAVDTVITGGSDNGVRVSRLSRSQVNPS